MTSSILLDYLKGLLEFELKVVLTLSANIYLGHWKFQINTWAGGLAWLRYRLDMAGVVGSNPTRPIPILTLYLGPDIILYEDNWR